MSQGSGEGNWSGRGKVSPNSVREFSAWLAPPRGVSAHLESPAQTSGLSPCWETPPLGRSRPQQAPAEFCSLMPDSFILQILSANSTGLALGAKYTVKTKIGVAFSLSKPTDCRKIIQ